MKALHWGVALLVVSGFGCGSSKPKATVPPEPASVVEETVGPKDANGTEVASGSLADAILNLRRVHFALDSWSLTPPSRTALNGAADGLKAHADVHIYVEGHADERGTSEYNVALAERRAKVVVEYLTRLGIDASRLHVVSYGEERPLDSGHGAKAYDRNRRVDFSLMRGAVRLVLEDGAMGGGKGKK